MWTVPESSFSKTAKCSNRTRCYWEWWWGEQWKKKKKQRQVETCKAPGDFRFCRAQHATGYTADTLSDSHTVSHSCVLLMDTSACLYQSFWDDCPSGCSGSVTPESKKKQKKTLCLFCVLLAFCILMWHTLRNSGTTRCGGAGCVGTGMHMQQIAQIETELCWLDTGAKNNSG